jgi:hypothetical protein
MRSLFNRRHAAKWAVLAVTLALVQACTVAPTDGFSLSGPYAGSSTIPAIAGGY